MAETILAVWFYLNMEKLEKTHTFTVIIYFLTKPMVTKLLYLPELKQSKKKFDWRLTGGYKISGDHKNSIILFNQHGF
jgi:hypothetical protein